MYDPKKVYAAHAYEDYLLDLRQLRNICFNIRNMADDLHLDNSERGEKVLEALLLLEREAGPSGLLRTGDGEE